MRPVECLKDLDLDGGWHVDELFKRPPMSTGGYSSFSYIVSNKEGKKAFLKALDFSAALQSADPTQSMEDFTKAYNFERRLLYQCKNKRLRHVVVPLADGTAKVQGNFGALENVPYLIFEMAEGDIRSVVAKWRIFDLAWVLRSLHQSAIGLQELHSLNIAHQDIKPSNVLVFPVDGSKLTDLGSATQAGNPSGSDNKNVAGDPSYSTPEQWYGWNPPAEFSDRYLNDLYRLGHLLFFFFADCSATDAIQLQISTMHGKGFVRSGFISDLPYIQQAFAESINVLRTSVEGFAGDLTDEIIMITEQLCEPDPRLRGDPKARTALFRPQSDLQPYISRFDRLARRAERKMV